jgi:redox-sensing transcriptional repressor
VHDREVLPIAKLPNLARRMHVLIGIITVPAPAAQEVADLMVQGGIRAIWNFAPMRIEAPDNVIVQNEDLYATLGVLLQRLNTTLREE